MYARMEENSSSHYIMKQHQQQHRRPCSIPVVWKSSTIMALFAFLLFIALLSILVSVTRMLVIVLPGKCNVNTTRNVLSNSHYCSMESLMDTKPSSLLSRHTDKLVTLTNTTRIMNSFSEANTGSGINITWNLKTMYNCQPNSLGNKIPSWTPGYILVIFYRQQLQSATNELFHLANLAAKRRMQIVEPLLSASNLQLPSISSHYTTISRFGDIYNLTTVNLKFAECLGIDYPIIIPFQEFVTTVANNSLADATLLNLMKIQIDQWCYNKTETQLEVEATEQLVNYHIQRAIPGMSYTLSCPIQISRAVCVNATGLINIEAVISNALRTHERVVPPSFLVLPEWRGMKPDLTWFWYYDPDYVPFHCPIATLKHSNTIEKEANHMKTHLNLTRPTLGIHIRIEKLSIYYDEDTIRDCIDKVIVAAEALRDDHSVDLHNAIAIRDYSKLGTHTCATCSHIAERTGIDEQLLRHGINIVEYNATNAVTGASGESGFASFVEKELLSQMDYLLTVGGGSYQGSIMSRFVANHPTTGKQRISQMCNGQAI